MEGRHETERADFRRVRKESETGGYSYSRGKRNRMKKKRKDALSPEARSEKKREQYRLRKRRQRQSMSQEQQMKVKESKKKAYLEMDEDARERTREKHRKVMKMSRTKMAEALVDIVKEENPTYEAGVQSNEVSVERERRSPSTAMMEVDDKHSIKIPSVYPVVEDASHCGVFMCHPCEDQGGISTSEYTMMAGQNIARDSVTNGPHILTPDGPDDLDCDGSSSVDLEDDGDPPSSDDDGDLPSSDDDGDLPSSEDEVDDAHSAPLYCHNCMRAQVARHSGSVFEITFHMVNSSLIRKVGSHLRHLVCHNGDVGCEYRLCTECRNYLTVRSEGFASSDTEAVSWQNTWPSFFWNLLTGKDVRTGRHFLASYDAAHIWRFVPENARDYWIPALTPGSGVVTHVLCRGENRVQYRAFEDLIGIGDGEHPGVQSYFVDRTEDIQKFREDISMMDLLLLMRQLAPNDGSKPIMLPDVLCPWGCSEFSFRASNIEMGLIVQHHLRKVQLNFPCNDWYTRLYDVETSRSDYIRQPSVSGSNEVEMEYDTILLNNQWRVRPQVELVPQRGLCAKVCRHHDTSNTRKRLYPHPPRKPITNLCAEEPDELCHAQIQPRLFKTMQPCAYNTKLTMHTQEASFAGVSSASIRRTPRFRSMSPFLREHEALSVAGRQDLNHLGGTLVREKLMSDQLFQGMRCAAKEMFPKSATEKFIEGATYVGLADSMVLQMNPKRSTVTAIVKRRNNNGQFEEVTAHIQRSWAPLINFLQTEDSRCYGSPFKAIPHYQGSEDQNTMIQWAFVGVIAGCKEVHRAIDQKKNCFHHEQWPGHVLAHVHNHCVPHDDNFCPRGSPFKPKRSNLSVLRFIEKVLPDDLRHGTSDDLSVFYRFNTQYWRNLFCTHDYPTISVNASLQEAISPNSNVSEQTDIVIIVGTEKPSEDFCGRSEPGHVSIRDEDYEARVIMCIDIHGRSPNSYRAVRFMRHGAGFSSWWCQRRMVRSPSLVTEYVPSRYSANMDFPDLGDDCLFYVTVYVKSKSPEASQYKLDFHRSLGGQTHVFCGCIKDPFPLITTARRKTSKRVCMNEDCDNKEQYICSVPSCSSRLCKNCFDSYPTSQNSVISPPTTTDTNRRDDVSMDNVEVQADGECGDDDSTSDDDSYRPSEDESVTTDDDVSQSDEGFEYDGDADMDDDSFNVSEDYDHSESSRELRSDEDYDVLTGGQSNEDNDSTVYEDEIINEESNLQHVSLRERVTQVQKAIGDKDPEENRSGRRAHERDIGDFVLDDFVTTSDINPMDCPGNENVRADGNIPMTNSGDHCQTVYTDENTEIYPCHVLFNQAGSLCTRYNKRIKGTLAQQNFVQRLVSTIAGFSVPLLYLMASCFPRHFWASSTKDPCAILGSAPLSCYSDCTHPNGFASTLSIARNLSTHASSSTSTDPTFMGFLYDIQANKVAGGLDSRLISRRGFIVDVKSKDGINLRESESKSILTESVDTHQAALDLAGTQDWMKFHMFLTFTCNQSEHPGIKHLHKHKESYNWGKNIPGFFRMDSRDRGKVKRSFEMAYGSVLGRCWMETRKLWLEYITYSTSSILGRTTNVFFRDEYQEESGNLPHIHGLVALDQGDMSNEEFHKFVAGLQKSAVCDLFQTSKIKEYVANGLFERERDWVTLTAKAEEVLSHRCSQRCLKRIGPGDGPENFVCRKVHSVRGKTDPLVDEMLPFQYEYSQECLEVLRKAGLWDPPSLGAPNGTFRHDLLVPKRHMGALHPGATCNMSPCIPEWFAFSRSMQNAQILTGTTGVARYVVKYVVKLDEGNRCTIWADAHSGAVMRVEKKFLHNTKVTTSKINEEKAHQKSRGSKHTSGRAIAFPEIQQQILGYPEVMTDLNFERICTKPFELRSSTKIRLNEKGELEHTGELGPTTNPTNRAGQTATDVQEAESPTYKVRKRKGFPDERQMSYNQQLLYGRNIKGGAYDKVTQFGLRPVELLQLFPLIGRYYRWFRTSKERLDYDSISECLHLDVRYSSWIDGIGREVQLRRGALSEVNEYLQSIDTSGMHGHSIRLREHILDLIGEAMHGDYDMDFICDDKGANLPIPVFSSVTPNKGTEYILHMMLTLGSFETELDLRMQPTLRESLATAGLIGRDFEDPDILEGYVNDLVRLSLTKVLSLQPIGLRKLDQYVVTSRLLFESIVMRNEIPASDLPECILTTLRDNKEEKLVNFWKTKRKDQLRTIYKTFSEVESLPPMDEVLNDTLVSRGWDGLASFQKYDHQTRLSFQEQQTAIKVGLSSLQNYSQQFGGSTRRFTKSVIIHGGPGTGKSHVTLYLSLCAMAMGLRVMTTAIMGVRANALGGIHIHRLFGIAGKKKGNPYRLAELAMEKLHRKNQLEHLHVLLTMDVLVIDELGQLSAEQLTTIDIILRCLRNSRTPFGGVLIFASMDHTQIGAIKGWPVLLSSHITSSFTLIKLSESVRAYNDDEFQEFQRITRMSATSLKSNNSVRERFIHLVKTLFPYVPDWDHRDIGPHVQRMYSRRMPAYGATMEYVSSLEKLFAQNETDFTLSIAKNYQSTVGARAEPTTNVSHDMMKALNHGLKEPEKLIFFRGAQFEATMNGEGFSQSQLMIMLEVPSEEDVHMGSPITLMAAPPRVTQVDLTSRIPTEEELIEDGWTLVKIGHARQQSITIRGISGYRVQYALKHVGSGTINQQQGRTIEGKCAVECTEQCSPFCKEQVVVAFSRTRRSKNTIIVGDPTFVANRLWSLITVSNQWTEYIEVLLSTLSINADRVLNPCPTFHVADRLPYRTCDIQLPCDASGYVYLLVSVRDFDRDYIGQCENLSQRLDQHNRGTGALGTASPQFRPYFPAAYICGLSHFDKEMRENLERKWKLLNLRVLQNGHTDIMSRIEQGRRVVSEYNERLCELAYRIRFVVTIKSEVARLSEAEVQNDVN